jgi:hypothetical protein
MDPGIQKKERMFNACPRIDSDSSTDSDADLDGFTGDSDIAGTVNGRQKSGR